MNKPVSRQRLWQLEQRAKGNCQICAQPSGGFSRCYACAKKTVPGKKLYYAAHKPQIMAAQKAWREKNKVMGLCPCGRAKPRPGRVTCQVCADWYRNHRKKLRGS